MPEKRAAHCVKCGCTDVDCRQCIEAQGYPCKWVAPGKCSRCFSEDGTELKIKAEREDSNQLSLEKAKEINSACINHQYFSLGVIEDWTIERVNHKAVNKKYRKYDGTVMFPTTHDITEGNLDACIIVLKKLLAAGNQVLIVGKPHERIIKLLCLVFQDYKDQILFRFTIGAWDDRILGFWEPGAPSYAERYAALYFACNAGFRTSVSCEPLLQPAGVVRLVKMIEDVVTDTIWIGTSNKLYSRTAWCLPSHHLEIERILLGQCHTAMSEIYHKLKDNPKIRWKDSYKRALGLKQPEKAGMDI